jgi:MFS transporter, SP family, sugar:H+ symporter
MQWVANFIVSTTFPPMVTHWGLGASYLTYAICAAVSIVFVAMFVRETKGRELESMA